MASTEAAMMSIDEFGGNPLRSLPPTSSIRQKKIEQNGKKQHKKRQLPTSPLPKHNTVPPMRLKYCSISFTFDPAENGELVGQTISGSTYQYMITLGK